jgi:hypothetical protein
VYDATFSHAYSFFLVASLVALTDRWWMHPTTGVSLAIGAISALIVLTRHTNAIFLLMVPLYGIGSWPDVRRRIAALWGRRVQVACMVAVASLGVLPQLAIYRAATGSWFITPYGGLDVGFNFRAPHLVGVLFGPQKGLFFWSPVLLLAVAGLFVASGWARSFVLPAIVILALDTYLIASWSDWQFGGSFGHRAFTDGFGLLAILLAAFFAWVAERPRLVAAVAVVTSLAVLLSTAQMLQYWMGVLPIADTTWDQYRALFLRFQ